MLNSENKCLILNEYAPRKDDFLTAEEPFIKHVKLSLGSLHSLPYTVECIMTFLLSDHRSLPASFS